METMVGGGVEDKIGDGRLERRDDGRGTIGDGRKAAGGALLVGMFPDVIRAVQAHWTSWGRARPETGGRQSVDWHEL